MRNDRRHSSALHRMLFLAAFMTCSFSILYGQSPVTGCTDFQDKTYQGWTSTGVAIKIISGGPEGAGDYYIHCRDLSGNSRVFASPMFTGNWGSLASGPCGGIFSFDIILHNDGDASEVFRYRPNFTISGGGLTARFICPQRITESGDSSGWHHFEAYFVEGPAPPEGWRMITGSDADWNTLLRNVSDVIFGYDHTSYQTEQFGFDNICMRDSVCNEGMVCCMKFHDLNDNGKLDAGEPPLENWKFVLTNRKRTLIDSTDANGVVCFYGIPTGMYELRESMPDGWHANIPPKGEVDVTVTSYDSLLYIFLNATDVFRCDSLGTTLLDSDSCLHTAQIINKSGVPVTHVDYIVSGGTVNDISLSPCAYTLSTPVGTTGSVELSPAYSNDFFFNIAATTAEGSGGISVTLIIHHETGDSCIVPFHYSCIRKAEGICSISAPTQLTKTGYTLSPNPFSVQYTIANKGNADLDLQKVVIVLPTGLTTTGNLEKTASTIAPGLSSTYAWLVTAAKTSKDRNAVITMYGVTADNDTIPCEHTVFIPGIEDISCEALSENHIVFDASVGAYTPNPFTASLTLTSHLDVESNGIEAEIDLTNAPHIALASGETATRTLTVLAGGGTHTFHWNLEALSALSAVTETISMRYRTTEVPDWRECTWDIIIDKEIPQFDGSCFADGIDSAWTNSTSEIILPNPIQVYCGFTNTGWGTLTSCNMTVHSLDPDITLYSRNEIEWKETLKPGETGIISFLLAVQNGIQPDAKDITFTFMSTELTQQLSCIHTVYVTIKEPIEQGRSHKRIYFRAYQNETLPAAEEVLVFAGYPTEMPWAITGYDTWLDVTPASSQSMTMVSVCPNTTNMSLGRYTTSMSIGSSLPNSPSGIDVVYDIEEFIVSVPSLDEYGFALGTNYPNPFTSETIIPFTTSRSEEVTLRVYNTLGEIVSTSYQRCAPGTQSFTVRYLPSGIYLYTLQTGHETYTGRMVRQ